MSTRLKCYIIVTAFTQNKFVHVCVSMSIHHRHVDAPEGQKRVLGPLELELEFQVALSCPVWVLGTKLWSSGRAVSALDC